MINREAFETWWKLLKPAECDEVKQYFEECWQAATAAALERAAQACEAIENDKWALYKGRKPYTGKEPGRASDYAQGQSDGAGDCAEAIRALKDES